MKNLRFYEYDTDFKAKEIAAGGDGNSVKTTIPGVASVWAESNTYFNPHDEAKLTHTITINYKASTGEALSPSETIEVSYYSGVTQEIVLTPKNIEGYVSRDERKTAIIPYENSLDFIYDSVYALKPLTFRILSGGSIYWKDTAPISQTMNIKYRKNGGDPIWIYSSNLGYEISVKQGDILEFYGDYPTYYANETTTQAGFRAQFSASTGTTFEIEGNIMSLNDSTGFTTATTFVSANTFMNFFSYCKGLTSAKNLILPATRLTSYCYTGMFKDCTSLTVAPAILPAMSLPDRCYISMFQGCTSLTATPELPAASLNAYCYQSMFRDCTSLTVAPELPATTLTEYCYSQMFAGCTGLTSAPELPATRLGPYCYSNMFEGCTSLATAPELSATPVSTYCYQYMFRGCTSLTAAPELPATTLLICCYRGMFQGCTSLKCIKCLATNISASDCTNQWTRDVASSGTFIKNPNMSSWTTGTAGIPNGWTIQDA